jgi:hypothetical protein
VGPHSLPEKWQDYQSHVCQSKLITQKRGMGQKISIISLKKINTELKI